MNRTCRGLGRAPLRIFQISVAAMLAGAPVFAQLMETYDPPRSNCCASLTAKTLTDQLEDWAQLGRYHAANEELKARPDDPKRVVFMGDSITDSWRLAESFPDKPYVDRGISGQTTSQMLLRMFPDVIDLKPAAMVLLAGTNDIARITGPVTLKIIAENIMAMTELAQRHGIKVILCAMTPVNDYTIVPQNGRSGAAPPPSNGNASPARRVQTKDHPPADILQVNAWLKDYAAKAGVAYVDYHTPLVDDKGFMKDGFSSDGLHPNAKGRELMAPLVEAAIRKLVP